MFETWNDNLKIGVAKIDQQHQKLFNKVGTLLEKCTEQNELRQRSTIEELIDFLIDYFSKHFADEEKIQRIINYPNYEHHKEIHNNFKEKLVAIKKDFVEKNKTLKIIISLNHEILKLFSQHIKEEDKNIGDYITLIKNEQWQQMEEMISDIQTKK